MPFEVVQRQRRHAERRCQRFGKRRADQERAGQPGPLRVGDRVHLGERAAGLGERLAQQRREAADVVARGKFGDDAAVVLVHCHLRVQRMREQLSVAVAAVEGDAGFVAGGFDTEN